MGLDGGLRTGVTVTFGFGAGGTQQLLVCCECLTCTLCILGFGSEHVYLRVTPQFPDQTALPGTMVWQLGIMQGSRDDGCTYFALQSSVQWQFDKKRSPDLPRVALLALHAFVEALLPGLARYQAST